MPYKDRNNEKIITTPTRHLERVFGDGSVVIDGTRYPVFLNRVAGTVTISSVAVSYTHLRAHET